MQTREKVADGKPVPFATGGGPSPASTALLSVARRTRTSHRLTSTHISLPSRHGRGTRAGRGPAPRSRRNRTPNGPGFSPLSHHCAHSSTPNTRGNSPFSPAIPNSLRPPRSRPVTSSGDPGVLVTSPQDPLITVRAVIITVRRRSGAPGRAAARSRLSRRNFAFRKYAVTCGVSA